MTFIAIGGPPFIEGLIAPGDGDGAIGDDIVFVTTFVPEPGPALLLGAGLMALARRPARRWIARKGSGNTA